VTRAFVAIGSNLGDRLAHLQAAVDGLAATSGIAVVAVSSVYETDPVGPDQPDYLNAVVALDLSLSAHELLRVGQGLETAAARVRGERWGPRTLDVDVLLVDDEVIEDPDLTIPHPRMAERGFVLVPLADVAPEAVVRLGLDPADRDWPGVRPTGLTLVLPTLQ
jgi:2-amino-4-hydroxy-6-hydroxymethyldihydropteridine diphosphokinase